MRMERPAVGKGKGQYGDSGCARMTSKNRQGQGLGFCGRKGGGLGWGGLRRDPSRSKDALRMTARTNNGKNKQRQEHKNKQRQEQTTTKNRQQLGQMRGFFAALRMTNREGCGMTNNRTGNGKGQYGDSGCARMTARGRGARPHLSRDETAAKMGHPAILGNDVDRCSASKSRFLRFAAE